MRVAGLLIALVLFGLAARRAEAAAPCSPDRAAAAGAAVRQARARLTAIPVGSDMEIEVSRPTRRAMEALKDRIRVYGAEALRCAPAHPDAKALQAAVSAGGDAFEDTAPFDPAHPTRAVNGNGLGYEVVLYPDHPDLLGLVARVQIACGDDGMLMLYRRGPSGWRELMVRRSRPYRDLSGVWSSLEHRISPDDARGRWYLATMHGGPWCVSNWHGLDYDLSRPGPAPGRPHVFFKANRSVYLGYDEPYVMRAEAGWFEQRRYSDSMDIEVMIRRHIDRYAINSDRVTRIQPVAENARDFVDEWASSPWREARTWSAPRLRRRHALIARQATRFRLGFEAVRHCPGGLTEFELDGDRGPTWFLVVSGTGPYRMAQVSRRARPGCNNGSMEELGKEPAGLEK